MNHSFQFTPPASFMSIKCLDMHTEGEPLRIIYDGLPAIEGDTILEKRAFFKAHYDHIRTGLMWEPRGHADQYGAILTKAEHSSSDFGVFFLHNEGYSTMCGHAIIAITKAVYSTSIIGDFSKRKSLHIDTPAGRIEAFANWEGEEVVSCHFNNVPSFVYKKGLSISIPEIGDVQYDIAFGGAYYAFLNVDQLALELSSAQHDQIIKYGQIIKAEVMATQSIQHPIEKDLSFLYGVIFVGNAHSQEHHSRNVCIFAEGELDRSPTGTGVSGRAALHFFEQELSLNEAITIESILGSLMTVKAIQEVDYHGYPAIIPNVKARAFITGQQEFYFDPKDPLKDGFIFR